MKKTALLMLVLALLAACSSQAPAAAPAADTSGLEAQLAEKEAEIAGLEEQLASLNEQLALLQEDHDALLAGSGATADAAAVAYMCESTLENMKYGSVSSAIDILEGWFALQPDVAQVEGKYSTQFWTNVNSRIHTIRYISEESGLSETGTFLIFFEEGGWREGLLDMTNQCWLDFPETAPAN